MTSRLLEKLSNIRFIDTNIIVLLSWFVCHSQLNTHQIYGYETKRTKYMTEKGCGTKYLYFLVSLASSIGIQFMSYELSAKPKAIDFVASQRDIV